MDEAMPKQTETRTFSKSSASGLRNPPSPGPKTHNPPGFTKQRPTTSPSGLQKLYHFILPHLSSNRPHTCCPVLTLISLFLSQGLTQDGDFIQKQKQEVEGLPRTLSRGANAAKIKSEWQLYYWAAQHGSSGSGVLPLLLVSNATCKFLPQWQSLFMVEEHVGPVNYRVPEAVDQMLQDGLIEKHNSSWSSPTVAVPKPDENMTL